MGATAEMEKDARILKVHQSNQSFAFWAFPIILVWSSPPLYDNIQQNYFWFSLDLDPKTADGQTGFTQCWQKITKTFLKFGQLVSLRLPVDEQNYWPLINQDYFTQSLGSSLQVTTNCSGQRERKGEHRPAG